MSVTPEPGLVSVVIPTLGRTEVNRAVLSVLQQDMPVEILVVNDSGAPLTLTATHESIRVIDTTGREGASAARNRGMAEATGEFVAFLDDDDVWLDGHLRDAVAFLREHPEFDIYASRGLVTYSGGFNRLEPVDTKKDSESFLDYSFGPRVWLTRGRRVLTPTLVFRAPLAAHRFDTALAAREDTWWLLTAERDGHRLHQSENVGVHVRASWGRSVGRDSFESQMDFAHRVDSINEGSGVLQLVTAARGQAMAGEPGDVVTLGRAARSLPHGDTYLPVFALAAGVGALRPAVGRRRTR